MKKKGFTLIELVVVVAIILLLAATLAPKLRNEVAKARDAKAVASLGSIRTAANIYYADKEDPADLIKGANGLINASGDSEYLDSSLVAFLNDGGTPAEDAIVNIGGSKTASDATSVRFGGDVTIDYTPSTLEAVLSPNTINTTTGAGSNTYDTKGNAWASY